VDPGGTTAGGAPPDRLPLRPGPARFLVLFSVLLCAACGLVYELALTAVGGHLGGDPVTETSLVLSLMVFAMGVGALAAKPLAAHAAAAFAVIELVLAVVGGSSGTILYTSYLWTGGHRPALLTVSVVLGLLIGAEIPLLMTLLQRIRRQEVSSAVADLFAADYVGALFGGLLFPFVLLPHLGIVRTVAVAGVVNALAAAVVVLWLFAHDLGRRSRVLLTAGLVAGLVLLGGAWVCADAFTGVVQDSVRHHPVPTGTDPLVGG
jgi:spermidine synthase